MVTTNKDARARYAASSVPQTKPKQTAGSSSASVAETTIAAASLVGDGVTWLAEAIVESNNKAKERRRMRKLAEVEADERARWENQVAARKEWESRVKGAIRRPLSDDE